MVRKDSQFDAHENHFLRRARNHEIRRSRRKRSLIMAALVWSFRLGLVGALAWGLGVTWELARTSPRYQLRRIGIAGATGTLQQEVAERLGGFRGQSIFSIRIRDVAAAAESHPWVRGVSVRRRLPDALEIQVELRSPIALAVTPEEILLVDREAVVLGPLRRQESLPPLGLPVITGDPSHLGRDLDRGLDALATLDRMAPELLESVSEVHLEERHLRLVLRNPLRTLWLTDAGIQKELQKYFTLKHVLAERVPAGAPRRPPVPGGASSSEPIVRLEGAASPQTGAEHG